MLRHLLKLIWNKKGVHSLFIIEIWASFMVLFGVLSLIVYNAKNYRQPIGFEYENVWSLDLSNNEDTTEVADKTQRIMQRLRAYPEVAAASRMSANTPFSANTMSSVVGYQKATIQSDIYETDQALPATLDIAVQSGKWYSEADRVSKFTPVVINEELRKALFANQNPLGKIIKDGESDPYKVVGTVGTFKAKGEFGSDEPGIFKLLSPNIDYHKTVLIKTKPGTDANFEAQLVRDMAQMVPGWGIEVSYLADARKNQHKLTLIPALIFLIISGFLLTNVALGLFGILNLSIAQRRSEIGLRRAMGATEGKVTMQFLGEIWVLATFSVLLGLLFAVQFPLLNVFDLSSSVYSIALLAATLIIFVIVTLCAWYPSRQAARIHPATALHEE